MNSACREQRAAHRPLSNEQNPVMYRSGNHLPLGGPLAPGRVESQEVKIVGNQSG